MFIVYSYLCKAPPPYTQDPRHPHIRDDGGEPGRGVGPRARCLHRAPPGALLLLLVCAGGRALGLVPPQAGLAILSSVLVKKLLFPTTDFQMRLFIIFPLCENSLFSPFFGDFFEKKIPNV